MNASILSVEEVVEQAMGALKQGNLAQAESICRDHISRWSNQADVSHVLGIILHHAGRIEDAITSVQEAIDLRPFNATYYNTLGYLFQDAGNLDEALKQFRQALAIDDKLPEVHQNLGSLLMSRGDWQGSEDHYRRAIALRPAWIEPQYGLGALLANLGRHEEARSLLQGVIQINPHHIPSHFYLGLIFQSAGEWLNAERVYHSIISQDPTSSEAHTGLGVCYHQQGKTQEALNAYERAIAAAPDRAIDAYYNLSWVHREAHQWEEAIAAIQKAIQIDPKSSAYQKALADVFHDMGQYERAVTHYRRVCDLDPTFENQLRWSLYLPALYRSVEDITAWRERLSSGIEWLAEQTLNVPDVLGETPAVVPLLVYQGLNDAPIKKRLAEIFRPLLPEAVQALTPKPSGERYRVAFISRYFSSHVIIDCYRRLMVNLPRDQFDVTLILSHGTKKDRVTEETIQMVDHVIELPPSLAQSRQLIADHHLDALVYTDIGEDPFTYFLAFTRLAKVQFVMAGQPETTGIPTIDYFISDQHCEPENPHTHYTESLLELQTRTVDFAAVTLPKPYTSRQALNLPEMGRLYTCPVMLYKVHPDMDYGLNEILKRDPSAYIVLVQSRDLYLHELVKTRLQKLMGQNFERVIFLPWLSKPDFLSLIANSDVVLDTWHFSGGNTVHYVFATGTPLIAWAGAYMRGQTGASLYRYLGMEGAIASTPESFIQLALKVAQDRDFRQTLVDQIQLRSHALFDNPENSRELAQMMAEKIEEHVRP